MAVVPFAKALFVCDRHLGTAKGKVDLNGLFNAIRPKDGYPYRGGRFCAFAQLVNGLGQVEMDLDIRNAETDELVYTSDTMSVTFTDRITVVQMVIKIEGIRFDQPGLYNVELFCNNMCDTQITLL